MLRSREIYADLRASVPDGPDGALRRVLGGPAAAKPTRGGSSRVHPSRRAARRPRGHAAALRARRRRCSRPASPRRSRTKASCSSVVELYKRPIRPPDDRRARLRPTPGRRRRRRDLARTLRRPRRRKGARSRLAVGVALAAGILVGPEFSLDRSRSEATLLGGNRRRAACSGPSRSLPDWCSCSPGSGRAPLVAPRRGGRRPASPNGRPPCRRRRADHLRRRLLLSRDFRAALGSFSRWLSAEQHALVDSLGRTALVWQIVRWADPLPHPEADSCRFRACSVLFPSRRCSFATGPPRRPWAFLDPVVTCRRHP